MAHYRENRLHPRLPMKRTICFYPMSKRRTGDDNWYALGFDARKQLMAGHARVGRTLRRPGAAAHHRVHRASTTGSGASHCSPTIPRSLKEIVYEMRFDEVSARYAEFGPFVTGLVLEPAEALRRVGPGHLTVAVTPRTPSVGRAMPAMRSWPEWHPRSRLGS